MIVALQRPSFFIGTFSLHPLHNYSNSIQQALVVELNPPLFKLTLGRHRSATVFADRLVLAIVFVSASVVVFFFALRFFFFVACFTTARSFSGYRTLALGREARRAGRQAGRRRLGHWLGRSDMHTIPNVDRRTLQKRAALKGASLSPMSRRTDHWMDTVSAS
jgi:hypothetical protein